MYLVSNFNYNSIHLLIAMEGQEYSTENITMQDLVENISKLFSRPTRKRYIDEDRGYVTREESEFRLFICNVGFSICLQIVLIVLVSVHFSYEIEEPKFTEAGMILWNFLSFFMKLNINIFSFRL